MVRLGSSAGCLLVALFCVYGYLASGELQGNREILWKCGYGTVGVVCFLATIRQALRNR